MGICWSFPAGHPTTPSVTGHLNTEISQTTSQTAFSDATKTSGFSRRCSIDVDPNGLILPSPDLREFAFSELKAATKNFKPNLLLGEGDFGKVYKGWLEEKRPGKNKRRTIIAVKKLNSESLQGFEEWQSEVKFLGSLAHSNIVKLMGYSREDEALLLVYEFMQRGSLENHLFGRAAVGQPLPWDIRLKIAIGAARGLYFLHGSDCKVIHRDIKASNILLDESFNAKISDFGFAKKGPSASRSHLSTRVVGNGGYTAPEYVTTGHLYLKSDVYGFGVVLLEMLTGLRAMDSKRPTGQQSLVVWMKPRLSKSRNLKKLMDSKLDDKYPIKSALKVAQLALHCVEEEPKSRPSMGEVLETLEQIAAATERPTKPRIRPRSTHRIPGCPSQKPLVCHSQLHRLSELPYR